MDLRLRGKTALITGGSRGIGKAVARELAREGVDVAIVARTLGPLQEAAAELAKESGRKIVSVTVDTTSDESVKAMVSQVADALGGRIDILVNSAAKVGGFAPEPRLSDVTDADFWDDMNTKVMGYLRCAREVAPYMQRNGWGRIINISGLGARNSGSILGSMRNVAVVAMTKNLADQLGPYGINVTVVHPGTTVTERRVERTREEAARQGISEEEVLKRLGANNAIGRPATAQEVAYVVTFLASPLSVSISGDVIAAGGGAGKSIYY